MLPICPRPCPQAFQAYRLLVLPVANTWMSWSLLNKLGVVPGGLALAAIGMLVLACLVLGVQVRCRGGHRCRGQRSAPATSCPVAASPSAAWPRLCLAIQLTCPPALCRCASSCRRRCS